LTNGISVGYSIQQGILNGWYTQPLLPATLTTPLSYTNTMPDDIPFPEPSMVLSETSTATQPSVLTSSSLSSHEIERICKAFIRLITAPERRDHRDQKTSHSLVSHTANQ
jgi:hypothetical protein